MKRRKDLLEYHKLLTIIENSKNKEIQKELDSYYHTCDLVKFGNEIMLLLGILEKDGKNNYVFLTNTGNIILEKIDNGIKSLYLNEEKNIEEIELKRQEYFQEFFSTLRNNFFNEILEIVKIGTENWFEKTNSLMNIKYQELNEIINKEFKYTIDFSNFTTFFFSTQKQRKYLQSKYQEILLNFSH